MNLSTLSRGARPRAMSRLLLLSSLALATVLGASAPAAAASLSEADRVIDVAREQVGDRYLFGATGPNQFDCSGFVYYSFREAGVLDRIGSKRKTAAGYFKWFKNRGLVSKTNPRPGDLVVYARNAHMGIYIGDGKAVSALVNPYGVKIHKVKGYLNISFKAYLRVNLTR